MDTNELRELQQAQHVPPKLRLKFSQVADDIEHLQRLAAMDKKFILSQETEIGRLRAILRSVAACEAHYERPPRGYIVPDMIMGFVRAEIGHGQQARTEKP